MAIQQVGGAQVYVITGSNRDPRLTSTGQSWANLVTQQKYRLWQEAQRQALLEMNYEQKSIAEQRAIEEGLRAELRKNIAATDSSILKLQQDEAKSMQAIQEMQAKEQNLRGRSKTISTGGSTKDPTFQMEKDYRLRKERARDAIFQRQKYLSGLQEDLAPLVDPNTGLAYPGDEGRVSQLRQQIADQETAVTDLVQGIADVTQQEQELAKMKAEGRVPKDGSGRTTYQTREKPIVTPESISYAPQIEALQAQREAYQKQLEGIPTTPTGTPPNLLARTRDVYQREFGRQPRQPLFSRQAEMEALGLPPIQEEPVQPAVEAPVVEAPVDFEFQPSTVEQVEAPAVEEVTKERAYMIPEAPKGITPEDYVQQFYYSQIEGKNLNQQGKRRQIMEAVTNLPSIIDRDTEDYTKALEQITKAWQKELSPQDEQITMTGMEKARRAEKIPQTELGKLVGDLYSPSSDMKPEDVQEMFDNAKTELRKEYSGKELDKALEILVQLHAIHTGV